LTVVVGVNVHETGRDDEIRRVDRLGGFPAELVVAVGAAAHFDDLASLMPISAR